MSARHLRIIRFEPPPAPAADAGHAPSAEASTAGAPAPDRPADASDLRGAAFDEGCARGIVAADGRMIAANRALHALLHWHNAPPEGGSILWAVDAADRPALERVLREAGESGGGTVDARCPITGDAFAFFRFEAAPLPGAPGPARPLLVTVHEVTRVRSLEEQMAQRGRLELLGRLAAGVVHDFNNLLTVVMAHANAIRSEPGCPRPLAADAEGILEASARAVALGRQVLSFSRRQSVQPECLDLNTLFAETRRLVAHLLGPGVALEFRPTPGLWCVRFDKGQMIQVIMNLAANARDAMDGGGTLSLETFNLEDPGGPADAAGRVPSGPCVMLRASDTGCGMDAATLARAFDPFFTTKAPGRGTGIGLATVDEIVRRGGGGIRVRSQPGRGTTFEVLLPKADPARASPAVPAVLVVETDDTLRRLVAAHLVRAGFRVTEANEPARALEMAGGDAAPPDVIVAGALPGTTGPELLARLRVRWPVARPLYLTDSDDAPPDPADPAAAALRKPFDAAQLAKAVQTALRGTAPRP